MKRLLLILSIAAGLTITGCGSGESDHSHGEDTHTHETEEHTHDEGMEATHQHEGEEDQFHSRQDVHTHEGEESGGMLALNETYEDVRKGVHLTLSYNSDTGTFSGTVENTTQEALPGVAAGIELSNGMELGPTSPVDLAAGESHTIELDASGETFDSWSAHSVVGSGGHSHGENANHEH